MNSSYQSIPPLRDLSKSFRKTFLEICSYGYRILGRTPSMTTNNFSPWQFISGYPPSYSAQGSYLLWVGLADTASRRESKSKAVYSDDCFGKNLLDLQFLVRFAISIG